MGDGTFRSQPATDAASASANQTASNVNTARFTAVTPLLPLGTTTLPFAFPQSPACYTGGAYRKK